MTSPVVRSGGATIVASAEFWLAAVYWSSRMGILTRCQSTPADCGNPTPVAVQLTKPPATSLAAIAARAAREFSNSRA